METIIKVGIVLFIVGFVVFGGYIWWHNYFECRDAGFSFMYCASRK